MSSRRDNIELMRNQMLLGQRVAREDELLRLLACVNPDIRELIGLLLAYNILNYGEDKAEYEFQDEVKALIALGKATWPRKELTDLALKVGDTAKQEDWFADE